MDYAAMTTAELRNKAREARNAGLAAFADVSGLQIAGMKREELLARFSGAHVAPEAHETAKTEPTNNGGASDSELINLLAQALGSKIKAQADIDANQVGVIAQALIDSALENSNYVTKDEIGKLAVSLRDLISNRKQEITVVNPEAKKIDVGMQHKVFEKLLKLLTIGHNVFAVGPAGSGKTHIAQALAKALDVPYYYVKVGPTTGKADIFGFQSVATGQYQESQFYKACKNGGLILFDEIDSGDGGLMTMLNGALDNGLCDFPGQEVFTRHEKFYCLATANTFGRGADRVYVGRNAQDGATLERFTFVVFYYDEKLELSISGNEQWAKKMHVLREIVEQHKAKLIVSMRAVLKGAELLAAGFKEDDILDMIVFKGYNSDAKSAILRDWKARVKNADI